MTEYSDKIDQIKDIIDNYDLDEKYFLGGPKMATINKTSKLYAGDKFAITTTDGRKLRLVIERDQFPEDPRSWDNLGTMLCCHRDYQLGDCNSNRETEEQLAEICREYGKSDEEIDEMTFAEEVRFILDQDNVCGLPLWIYDHSGISMSTRRQCSWDSSFVGLIFVEKDFYLAQMCLKDEENWKAKAKKTLESEVEIYNDFLEGNVYQWALYEPTVVIRQSMDGKELSREIDEKGEMVDSMGGFYNSLTFEDADAYFNFEIAEVEQID